MPFVVATTLYRPFFAPCSLPRASVTSWCTRGWPFLARLPVTCRTGLAVLVAEDLTVVVEDRLLAHVGGGVEDGAVDGDDVPHRGVDELAGRVAALGGAHRQGQRDGDVGEPADEVRQRAGLLLGEEAPLAPLAVAVAATGDLAVGQGVGQQDAVLEPELLADLGPHLRQLLVQLLVAGELAHRAAVEHPVQVGQWGGAAPAGMGQRGGERGQQRAADDRAEHDEVGGGAATALLLPTRAGQR